MSFRWLSIWLTVCQEHHAGHSVCGVLGPGSKCLHSFQNPIPYVGASLCVHCFKGKFDFGFSSVRHKTKRRYHLGVVGVLHNRQSIVWPKHFHNSFDSVFCNVQDGQAGPFFRPVCILHWCRRVHASRDIDYNGNIYRGSCSVWHCQYF